MKIQIAPDVVMLGMMDETLRLFESQYPLEHGVSYNSYVILDERIAVLDAVDARRQEAWLSALEETLGGREPDFLVVSHVEPDHSGALAAFAARYPGAVLLGNAKTFALLDQFAQGSVTLARQVVAEGEELCLGRHTLRFLLAPMVHWPEVMVSFECSEGVLFSADAFGRFGSLDSAVPWEPEARRYYANIVGKYGAQVQSVLKKAAGLELNYVCPLHGFVWRSHFGDFLEKYLLWSSYTPEEKGVMIAYASVYGHTENTVNILACKLAERGIKTKVFDTSVTPASYILSEAFRYSHLVLASTTYNAGIFVTMENLIHDIVNHNLQGRKIALLENGSWAAASGRLMKEELSKLRGTEFIGETVSLKSDVTEPQLAELDALADAIAADIRPVVAVTAVEPVEAGALDVDNKVFNRFSYGVEVLTTRVDGKDYGCIINTAGQVASCDPKKITISVIKKNNTCDMVAKAGKFNISILTEETPYSLFQHFGFQSGRDVDKFADFTDIDRMSNGIPYVTRYTNAVLSCEVIDVKDVETQMLYIANVVEAKVLSEDKSCTYAYYHAHIKPKKNPAPPQGEGYICKVCGYFHEGSELPADFVCPLCKHGPEDFEHVVPVVKEKVKGYVCTICGHFEPCEGELPADYTCPLCHHGPEDFEPAEQ